MGARQLKPIYILLFYVSFVCLASSGLVVRHMIKSATLHHAAHITVCNLGESLDPLVVADWAEDVREYATRTPCWWAPTRWLLEGMLAGALVVTSLWILWFLWGDYIRSAVFLAVESRKNNMKSSFIHNQKSAASLRARAPKK